MRFHAKKSSTMRVITMEAIFDGSMLVHALETHRTQFPALFTFYFDNFFNLRALRLFFLEQQQQHRHNRNAVQKSTAVAMATGTLLSLVNSHASFIIVAVPMKLSSLPLSMRSVKMVKNFFISV